jgi:hypothetical protein
MRSSAASRKPGAELVELEILTEPPGDVEHLAEHVELLLAPRRVAHRTGRLSRWPRR